MLSTRAIPSQNFLIKNHKKINEKWGFPTGLVIPATKFNAKLSNIGYLGINRILEKVNYSCVTSVQASDLKQRLEELEIKGDGVKIASVDSVNMYPSIKLTNIRKVVILLSRILNTVTKKGNQSMIGAHRL